MTRIVGFAKCRNEVVREGNVYRMLANLEAMGLDGGILCDDASTDGTAAILETWAKAHGWDFLQVKPEEQSFAGELIVKQAMMGRIHRMDPKPDFIYWTDADEVLDSAGTQALRDWVTSLSPGVPGARFAYTQLWRSASWARTDDGFDDGSFVRVWRYSPDLSFDLRGGTHRSQFPVQIDYAKTTVAPFHVIHIGNYGKNLTWKAIQYAGGLGGVDRHLAFGHTPEESLATGVGYDLPKWSKPYPTYRPVDPETLPSPVQGETRIFDAAPPKPFTMDEIRRIRSMGNMRDLKGWFYVGVPAYNRAKDLPRALNSLLGQRYEKWIAVVLDDGSNDETPDVMSVYQEMDPRIFYCRYNENRGGVAVNEIAMSMGVEMCENFSRLGSDDWWGPGKLEADVAALEHHEAVFGPFTVWKHGRADHVCAGSWGPANGASPSERLRRGEFLASWANFAVRTDVLRRVRERWGNFVDPSLHSMEDLLANSRIAHLGVEWVWHPGDPADAAWLCLENVGAPASASASANAERTARDHALSLRLIAAMQAERA